MVRLHGIAELAFLSMPAVWVCALAIRFVITARTKLNPLSRGRPADIGRSSFALFNDLEWVLLALMTPAIVFSQARVFYGTALSVLGFLLSFQSVWLVPKLNAQIASIVAQTPSQPSEAYLLYLGIDVAKIVFFAAFVWQGARRILPLLRISW